MTASSVRKLRVYIPATEPTAPIDFEAVGRHAAKLTAEYFATAFADDTVDRWLEKLARARASDHLDVAVETLGDVTIKLTRSGNAQGFGVEIRVKSRDSKRQPGDAARAAIESSTLAEGLRHAFAVHRGSSPGAQHTIEAAFRGEVSKYSAQLEAATDSAHAIPQLHSHQGLHITMGVEPRGFETAWNWPADAVVAAEAERAIGFVRTGAHARHMARMDLVALLRRDVLAAEPPL